MRKHMPIRTRVSGRSSRWHESVRMCAHMPAHMRAHGSHAHVCTHALACVVMAYVVMANVVMVLCSYGRRTCPGTRVVGDRVPRRRDNLSASVQRGLKNKVWCQQTRVRTAIADLCMDTRADMHSVAWGDVD